MDVYLLGAGASKAYDLSPTGVRMPLAREVFAAFEKLAASENRWVLTGAILTYARDKKGVDIEDVFKKNYDIEAFHSEVEEDLRRSFAKGEAAWGETLGIQAVYTQLVFFFACTVNEIQNGPVSPAHQRLVAQLGDADVLLTFNWDTLVDRALHESGRWNLDYGYGFTPKEVFRDGWAAPATRPPAAAPKLLKLHGSTNWITSYPALDPGSGEPYLLQQAPADVVRVYEFATKPYPTYAGRYLPGYEPFSLGYYPPNILSDPGKSAEEGHVFVRSRIKFPFIPESTLPDNGVPSAPLIIPPVKNKSYTLFGSLFERLWTEAEDALAACDRIFVIGYSFPVTDVRTIELFKKAFVRRKVLPKVVVVNPHPQLQQELFRFQLGIPDSHLEIRTGYFDSSFVKG